MPICKNTNRKTTYFIEKRVRHEQITTKHIIVSSITGVDIDTKETSVRQTTYTYFVVICSECGQEIGGEFITFSKANDYINRLYGGEHNA